MKVELKEVKPEPKFIPKQLVIDFETEKEYQIMKDLVKFLYTFQMDHLSSIFGKSNDDIYNFIMALKTKVK